MSDETEHCLQCKKDVLPIDGDCPMCGGSSFGSADRYGFASATLVVEDENGDTTAIGEVTDIEVSGDSE